VNLQALIRWWQRRLHAGRVTHAIAERRASRSQRLITFYFP
jgi:hypothetical protein